MAKKKAKKKKVKKKAKKKDAPAGLGEALSRMGKTAAEQRRNTYAQRQRILSDLAQGLSDDPQEALIAIERQLTRFIALGRGPFPVMPTESVKMAATISVLVERYVTWGVRPFDPQQLSGQSLAVLAKEYVEQAGSRVAELAKAAGSHKLFDMVRDEQAAALGMGLVHEFDDDDYARLQELVDELRKELKASAIPDEHRDRLVARLEALQRELNQTMRSMEKFWGFLLDLRYTTELMADVPRPVMELAGELLVLVDKVKSKAMGLPKALGTKLFGGLYLPPPDEADGDEGDDDGGEREGE